MNSWFNPKTEKRKSLIQGRGLFAREDISVGEIVAVKGGGIFNSSALAQIRDQIAPADIQIEDDLYIAPRNAAEVEESILCLNHSCSPNVGVRGQITFVAMCDVPAGSELTIDYAMIDGDPTERMDCSCGAPQCRGTITGDDWRLPDLQERYSGFFSRFIEDRFSMRQGVESTIDRISTDRHPLSGRAKDLASGAVLIAVLMSGLCWVVIAGPLVFRWL